MLKLTSQIFKVFSLLVSALTIPSFAIQEISPDCGAKNPLTGQNLSKMYYILRKGLCTNKKGIVSNTEYCALWTDNNFWSTIDRTIGKFMIVCRI